MQKWISTITVQTPKATLIKNTLRQAKQRKKLTNICSGQMDEVKQENY